MTDTPQMTDMNDAILAEGEKDRQFIGMTLALFLSYLAVALPLSILSIHNPRGGGLSNFLGGLGVGASFLSTIATRKTMGDVADRLGGKVCFTRGSVMYAGAGVLCMLAAVETLPVGARFAVLLAGRLLLGLGESMVNVSMVSWSVAMLGVARTGRVMSAIGLAMYAAFVLGSPIGYAVYNAWGFGALMALAALAPAAGFLLVQRAVPFRHGGSPRHASFGRIIAIIWPEGTALFLQGIGISVIGAFLSKTFLDRGWPLAGWGMSCFGVGFVLMRILIGHLPDRIGGKPVAIGSVAVESAGLYLLWLAPGPYAALAGSLVAGAGASMIYPSLGREVVLATPEALRGAALGCYAAFQDISYFVAGPIAGFLADRFGDQAPFLFSALSATAGLALLLAHPEGGPSDQGPRSWSGRLK
ncbi:MAG: MFS transporter [Planctomycetota bacterium]|jgi:MFS family permease|nr:MFS transporter [Planctomycetota bacterium]